MPSEKQAKIGIIGTGFIGNGLKKVIGLLTDMTVSSVLTHRNLDHFPGESVYTNSVQELIDKSDLVVECNGNPVYATEILEQVMEAGIPVVTLDSELHITSGSYLITKGFITEAEGDQPGELAKLHSEIDTVGFKPLVFGNFKGFLNHNPTYEEMQYWSKVQGISIKQVTEATDGTKVQIEQAMVANGLGAVIAKRGLYGPESETINEGANILAEIAKQQGSPISDYLLCSPLAKQKFPAGVFITAEFDPSQADALRYFRLGEGPYYTLVHNYHLCQLEVPNTIRQVFLGNGVFLNNSEQPTASVGAIAKKEMKPGTVIPHDIRSFHVRGEALTIKDYPNHVPIGLMHDVVVKRTVEPGQMVAFDDVDIPDSKAYDAWKFTLNLLGY
jgi:predicted homoserine dehydrogenase-like protein